MASFLKIRSLSRTNATDMFTLGVSTARGNAEKIGQFGTGSLMGTLLWMREYGDSPVFNLNGKRYEFESFPQKTEAGTVFHQVLLKEGRKKGVPMSIALEHGAIDWTKPEMALREWISNALDQGMTLKDSLSIVDRVDSRDDEVAVFVPLNGTCKKYWQEIDKHFLHLEDKDKVLILEKPSISKCKIYRKGVFIRELDRPSVFDYNLNVSIDESRNGSSDSMVDAVMDVVIYGAYGGVSLCEKDKERFTSAILRAVRENQDCIEVRDHTYRTHIMYSLWNTALQKLVGNTLFGKLRPNSPPELIEVQPHWQQRIVSLVPELDGNRDVSEALLKGMVIIENDPKTVELFEGLISLISLVGLTNKKERPRLETFKTASGAAPPAMGFYKNGIVSICHDCATSKQTLLEELCHHYSGFKDCSRDFQEYLFRMITEMSTYFRD